MFPLGVFLGGSDYANKYDYKAIVQKTDAAHAARRSAKAEQARKAVQTPRLPATMSILPPTRLLPTNWLFFPKDSFNLEIAWNKTNRPHCNPEVVPEGKKGISYPAAPI